MNYLLESTALLLLFFAGYKVFLQKETFFSANRWFLLLGLISSFLLPLIVIPVYETQVISGPSTYSPIDASFLPLNNNSQTINQVSEASTMDWTSILGRLYWIGVVVFAIRFVIQLVSVFILMKHAKRLNFKRYTIFETQKDVAPFSFFKAIIYNPFKLSDTAIEQILTHEKAHVKEWHSLDIVFSELCLVFMWFNPLLWWYQKSLKQNLEFIADEHSIKQVPCPKTYQTVLVNQSLPSHQLALTNNFKNSFLKKRIIMLNKSKSKPFQKLKMVYIIPFIALFLYNFSMETRTTYVTEVMPTKHEIIAEKAQVEYSKFIEYIFTKATTEKELNTIKDHLAKEGVTMDILEITIGKNNYITKINVEFSTKNGSANYHVSDSKGIEPFKFTLNSDGSFGVGAVNDNGETITQIAKGYNSKHPGNNVWVQDNGGIVKIISADSSARAYAYTLKGDSLNPIKEERNHFVFRYGSSPDSIHIETISLDSLDVVYDIKTQVNTDMNTTDTQHTYVVESTVTRSQDTDKDPLVIVDGKTVSIKGYKNLNEENIATLNVVKGDNATKLYGYKAKNGAIVITTKDGKAVVNSNYVTNGEEDVEFILKNVSRTSSLFKIDKLTTKLEMDKLKNQLKSQGIDVKYSKIKRNELGEITRIKISLKNTKGGKSSASYNSGDGIDTIYFGEQNGSLMVTTDMP